jgi:hypothetical protein
VGLVALTLLTLFVSVNVSVSLSSRNESVQTRLVGAVLPVSVSYVSVSEFPQPLLNFRFHVSVDVSVSYVSVFCLSAICYH